MSSADVALPLAANSGATFPRAKEGIVFSDFWEAYQAVIPDEQHQAVGKAQA